MAANVKKRTTLTFAMKLEIIKRIEKGEKKSSVADAYSIPRSTLSTLLKNKSDIKVKAAGKHSDAQRVREPNFEQVEKATHKWFMDVRARSIPVSGPMLQAKAKDFAFILNVEGFTASGGWLQRFKGRYDIVGKVISGESEAANVESIKKWLNEEWPQVLAKYEQKDIFNADETGLFWQMLPRQTLDTRGEKSHGGKQNKARITVLLAANMDGTTKLCPFVIGKFKTPHCMRNCRYVPVRYAWNTKSWMTRDLFGKWLADWDDELADKGRRVCLLVDNCTAHHTGVPLKNIELKFLPPNTTSKLQPLDQGIIRAFKAIYKRRLIETLLVKLRMKQELKIDLLGAIQMLKASWENVKRDTIANCFRHAGFVACVEELSEQAEGQSDEVPDESEEDRRELGETWDRFSRFVGAVPETMSIDDFVGDDDDATTAELTDIEIAAEVAREQPVASDEPGPADIEDAAPRPTSSEAVAAIAVLRRYCSAIEGSGLALVDCLDTVEQAVTKHAMNSKKQATLAQFFSLQ